jgi:hypothetical protein
MQNNLPVLAIYIWLHFGFFYGKMSSCPTKTLWDFCQPIGILPWTFASFVPSLREQPGSIGISQLNSS